MSQNAGVVRALIDVFPGEVVAAGDDPAALAATAELLAETTRPDFVTAMVAPDGWTAEQRGIEGFFSSWQGWVGGFDRFAIEYEDLIDSEEAVVVLVRQRGVPSGGSAEILADGAGVFRFAGATIERIEFHLDRDRALRSVGLES